MKYFRIKFTQVLNPVKPETPPSRRLISEPPPVVSTHKAFDMKVEGVAVIPTDTVREALDLFEKEFPKCEVTKISNDEE